MGRAVREGKLGPRWAVREEGGPSGERKRGTGPAGFGVLGWILVSGFSYFLSLSYFFSFQTSLKLIEFKLRFEFKPYALNQIKQCTSVNAQTNLALE